MKPIDAQTSAPAPSDMQLDTSKNRWISAWRAHQAAKWRGFEAVRGAAL